MIEDWILENVEYFISFLAGYTDAEGNIQRYGNLLRFRIRTYDKNILYQMHKKLTIMNIYSIHRLESRAGKYNQNHDCWSLSINKQEDIKKLSKLMLPHLKHAKRIHNLILLETLSNIVCLSNKYL